MNLVKQKKKLILFKLLVKRLIGDWINCFLALFLTPEIVRQLKERTVNRNQMQLKSQGSRKSIFVKARLESVKEKLGMQSRIFVGNF